MTFLLLLIRFQIHQGPYEQDPKFPTFNYKTKARPAKPAATAANAVAAPCNLGAAADIELPD